MKSIYQLTLATLFLALATTLSAQSVTGLWQNIDDEDGKPKSHIEISMVDGHLVGHVVKLLPAATLTHCQACKGDLKDAPIEGMKILWGMTPKKKNRKADGGRILDPKTGKDYKCKIELDGPDKLDVRGFIGSPIFGRTQSWYRVQG